jgi:hypothetical protein
MIHRITVSIGMNCDAEDCARFGSFEGRDVKTAIENARALGWTIPEGVARRVKTVCPECRDPKGKRRK